MFTLLCCACVWRVAWFLLRWLQLVACIMTTFLRFALPASASSGAALVAATATTLAAAAAPISAATAAALAAAAAP